MTDTHEPSSAPPPAQGVRVAWHELPLTVRTRVEQALGSQVVSSETQAAGFSPGVAARLRLADGRRVFVKAVAAANNPDAPSFHRREAAIVSALPAELPVPQLIWHDDGTIEDEAGWVVLAFEDIAGHNPPLPWQSGDIDRVMIALGELCQQLTPSPLAPEQVRSAPDLFAKSFNRWRRTIDAGPTMIDKLDPWSQRHLEALVTLEADAPAAVTGTTLLHGDIRADNILLTDTHVWFVDWPHACIGAGWVDTVLFAPSVTMQGGPSPDVLLARHPDVAEADPNAIDAAIAATAGFFTYLALLPPPPGLPTLRAFQAAQGVVARQWMAQRRGWT